MPLSVSADDTLAMSDPARPHGLTIYLLEHAGLIRLRLLRLLNKIDGVVVLGAGPDAETDLSMLAALHPDIVLVGLRATQAASLPGVRTLKRALPGSILIVLTNNGAPLMTRACLQAGGSYCFDKTLEVNELRSVLLTLASAGRPSDEVQEDG